MLLWPLHGAFLIIFFAMVVIKLFALIDCALVPERAFAAAGKQTKVIWLVILVVALVVGFAGFFSVIGLVAAIVYLVDVRPAVRGRGASYDRW